MGERGPVPKDPSKRVRADHVQTTTVAFVKGEQPNLPIKAPGGFDWTDETLAWWDMLPTTPQADLWSPLDWDYLRDTAVLHNRYWSGDINVAGELRQREAKFGWTAQDRQRLRLQYAQADRADRHRPVDDDPQATGTGNQGPITPPPTGSKARYGSVTKLRAVGTEDIAPAADVDD